MAQLQNLSAAYASLPQEEQAALAETQRLFKQATPALSQLKQQTGQPVDMFSVPTEQGMGGMEMGKQPQLAQLQEQTPQKELTLYDLPEEARPFSYQLDSRGRVKPNFNLNTQSGMAYYLRAQGLGNEEVANRLGVEPSQLNDVIQQDFRRIQEQYGGGGGLGVGQLKPSERLAISKEYGLPYGFTEEDLAKATPMGDAKELAKAQQETEAAKQAKTKAQETVDLIRDMQTGGGMREAIGFKGQSLIPDWIKGMTGNLTEEGFVSGTKAADYEAKLNRLKALLSTEGMQYFKGLGPMSEREFMAASAMAANLTPDMSEKAFKDELDRIEEKLTTAAGLPSSGQTTPTTGTTPAQNDMFGGISDEEAYQQYLSMQ